MRRWAGAVLAAWSLAACEGAPAAAPRGKADPDVEVVAETLSTSGDCAGLVPTARAQRYTDVARMTPGGVCLGGASDELSRVATGWIDSARNSHWDLHNPDGSFVTRFGARDVRLLVPQDAGFLGVAAAPDGTVAFTGISHEGVSAVSRYDATSIGGPEARQHVSRDDAGGALVVFAAKGTDGKYRVTAQRFDPKGRARSGAVVLATGTVPPAWVRGGVNDGGKSFVLFDGRIAGFPAGHGAARWLDRFGSALTPLFDAGPIPDLSSVSQSDLRDVPGGHFALQVNRTWIALFSRQKAQVSAPPRVLVENHGKRLRLMNGYTAYAFLPFPGEKLATCTQRVEIWSASGQHCGHVDFPADAGACVSGDLELGAGEGTVIQSLPAASETCSASGCTCTHRFYPHVLPNFVE